MDDQVEKVYVALGNDQQEGFKTLEWTLRKWSSHPINIVILHVIRNISIDLVPGPFGKVPASSVNEEMVEFIKKGEKERMDNFLAKYINYCGKVKAEILKVEKYDQPIYKLMVDLISGLRISKLVVGFTLMKSSSWKSKRAINGSFYVHRNKPHFCELFIVCGGKLLNLREDKDEGIIEDDQGVVVAKLKEKSNFKGWLGKMFDNSYSLDSNSQNASMTGENTHMVESQDRWEDHVEEIDNYFEELVHLYKDEKISMDNGVCEGNVSKGKLVDAQIKEEATSNMGSEGETASLRRKKEEIHKEIRTKRKEVKDSVERQSKAEWIIGLCNHRVEELEMKIKDEMENRVAIQNDVGIEKEQLNEVMSDLAESKSRLNALLQLQEELSSKLQMSTLAKAHNEAQLEKSIISRAEIVREIEELRRQRDVFRRRIEFCREKDAIGMASKCESSCGYREYTAREIRLATDNFSERLRIKSGGDWKNLYRGRINHATSVAIKVFNSVKGLSEESFLEKVKILTRIRHPHIVTMIGFCLELKCIIFEYVHKGSLRDKLYTPKQNSTCNRALQWHERIRIAHEISIGLGFLHSALPRPLIHGHLAPSSILLDRNLVAKIGGFGISGWRNENDKYLDIQALGGIMLQLLTGRNWAGLVEEAMRIDKECLFGILDQKAGRWPHHLAEEFAGIAMRCLSIGSNNIGDIKMTEVIDELEKMKKAADELVERGGAGRETNSTQPVDGEDSRDVPGIFLCPILQDIMKNPHVAADGFSYELEAIEEWLWTGHDTSPMTNLKLNHKFLAPNHTLRSLIEDWHSKRSKLRLV